MEQIYQSGTRSHAFEYSQPIKDESTSLLMSWKFRPLIPLAILAATGCSIGLSWPIAQYFADFTANILSGNSWQIMAMILIVAFVFLIRKGIRAPVTVTISLALVLLFAMGAAQHSSPPPGDISGLVRQAPALHLPQKPLALTLKGEVAAPPKINDWGMEFPLEVRSLSGTHNTSNSDGRVWASIPLLNFSINQGDVVELTGELFDLPRVGAPGERSRQARYIEERCWSLLRVKKAQSVKVLQRTTSTSWPARLSQLRDWLPARYQASFQKHQYSYSAATSQLLAAMVFGEGGLPQQLPRLTRDRWRAAGFSHLLVASGTQMSLLALALLGVTKFFGSRRWPVLLLIIPVLVFYALLAGGSSSIWRAAVAGLCLALALLLGRETDGLSLWSLALLVLLFVNPLQLHDLGFQLTFAATWGLLVLGPKLRVLLRNSLGKNWFCDAIAFSTAAQIATMPLLLYHFGRVSLVGFGANLVAVPIAGTLVATGIVGLIWSPINALNYHLVRFLDGIANTAAQLPGASPETPLLSLPMTLICYAALLISLPLLARDESVRISWQRLWHKQISKVRWQTLVVSAAVLLTTICIWNVWRTRDSQILVSILDVGQGEAIVIRSASRTVLIDAGTSSDEGRGDAGRAIVVPYLQSLGVEKLDAIVVTHADADHCSGIPAVLREIPADLVLDGAASFPMSTHNAPDYALARTAWQKRGIRSIAVHRGQKINMGDGAVLSVLAPIGSPLEGENNNAAVLRLDHGKVSFLLTADIEREAEEQLLQRKLPLQCTVLKVAHHGSKTSTLPEFVKIAKPQVAVISSGRYNRFGHPAPQTMERLQKAGVQSFRTDIHGTVEMYSDGKTLRVETFR